MKRRTEMMHQGKSYTSSSDGHKQPNIQKGFGFSLVVWGEILRKLVFVTVIYILQKRRGNDNDRLCKIFNPDKHGILVDMDWIWFAINLFGDISK